MTQLPVSALAGAVPDAKRWTMWARRMGADENGRRTAVLRVCRARLAASLVMLMAALLVSIPGASASVDSDPAAPSAAAAPHAIGQLQHPWVDESHETHASQNFWVSPSRRRAYFLAKIEGAQYRQLLVVDLDTGREVERRDLPFPAYREDDLKIDQVVVDEAGGRLFVMEGMTVVNGNQLIGGALNPTGYAPSRLAAVASGSVCARSVCATAIWEIDADTLEAVKRIPIPMMRGDGLMVAPEVLAMAHSPGTSADDAKIHLVISEANGGNLRTSSSTVTIYLMQLDVSSGVAEWTYRVEGCKAGRTLTSAEPSYSGIAARARQAAVMRDPRPGSPYVYVACHSNGNANAGTIVRIPLDERGNPPSLPVRAGIPADLSETRDPAAAREQATWAVGVSRQPDVFVGPEKAYELYADPVSGRMLMVVLDGVPTAQVMWVFDVVGWRLLGTIGIGRASNLFIDTFTGIDDLNGRYYALVAPTPGTSAGLYLADYRRTPLAQALRFEQFASLGTTDSAGFLASIVVSPGRLGEPSRVYVPSGSGKSASRVGSWTVLVDPVPLSADAQVEAVRRSLDLDEAVGVTSVSLDGAARGYGARALLVGGLEAATRVGPVDVLGNVMQFRDEVQVGRNDSVGGEPLWDTAGNPRLPCGATNREVVLGFVGPSGSAVVDATGARGGAEPVVTDSSTAADGEAPVSRCGTVVNAVRDWESLWTTVLFGRAPVDEPRLASPAQGRAVECASSGGEPSEAAGDPVMDGLAAAVECRDEEASGYAYARGFGTGLSGIAEALSSFRIYRDPGRGIVSRVESVARGVSVDGVLKIDTVRGQAESWANGRSQPATDADRESAYDANCDFERTAGTCFRRHVFGVWTPGFTCGPCGDERTLVERLNRAFGSYGVVRLRDPHAGLARGSEDGFTAAIQKPDDERFADLVLNNDLLQTVLPTLEIIRFTPPNRAYVSGGPRGRQVYQLAGVEVSSSYAIQCLLVFDEVTNTCGVTVEPPGGLTVKLTDPAGDALAGGAFELRQDAEADGLVGLEDRLVRNGACLTSEDGVGTCTFDGLQPGAYVLSQVAAPVGYASLAESFGVRLASGEVKSVTFTNVSDQGAIVVTAHTDDGRPLQDARFAVFPDPDADGTITQGTVPADTCATGADGVCRMRVATGSYVLVQSAVPAGFVAVEPVAFTLASAGQTATVSVVNAPTGIAAIEPKPASVAIEAPIAVVPPVQSAQSNESLPPRWSEPAAQRLPSVVGGTILRVIRAPGDALRLLARDPVQAVAWLAVLAMFTLALLAVRRRTLLDGLPGFGLTVLAGPGQGLPESASETGQSRPERAAGGAPAMAVGVVERRPVVAGAAPDTVDATTVRVVVATASPALASVVRQRLGKDKQCQIVSMVDSLGALHEVLRRLSPDVLVIDLALPTGSDADVCDVVGGLHPPQRTVGLIPSQRSTEALITSGYKARLAGLLGVDEDLANGQLAYAIRAVAAGKLWYGPSVQVLLVERWDDRPRTRNRRVAAGLTRRELQIAQLAAEGVRRSDIAARLFLSPGTVKRHLWVIRAKLGVTDPRDPAQLRRRLRELVLPDESPPPGATGQLDD